MTFYTKFRGQEFDESLIDKTMVHSWSKHGSPKPSNEGCFWGSPIGNKGVPQWMAFAEGAFDGSSEHFHDASPVEKYFSYEVDLDSPKCLCIKSYKDLCELVASFGEMDVCCGKPCMAMIDWAKVAMLYDAVYVDFYNANAFSLLSAYDVDTIMVFNPKIIENMKLVEFEKTSNKSKKCSSYSSAPTSSSSSYVECYGANVEECGEFTYLLL